MSPTATNRDPVGRRRTRQQSRVAMASSAYPLAMDELPLTDIVRIARAHGAQRVSIFGSRARGDARADSDLDLLILPGPNMSLFDLAGMQIELEELLGIEVDVVSERALHPLLAEEILAEARPLEAA